MCKKRFPCFNSINDANLTAVNSVASYSVVDFFNEIVLELMTNYSDSIFLVQKYMFPLIFLM